ncbi:MerR family transcriptional regulator [Photobacterium chitinilyticum]|uniref:MerR family transcriptional regulator n=1 Tax=Photobacterium chitinilyticum TaxID=2485123 RepID=A0A444JX82_9GAMM|nr:MerR family transcriptional regulator [Photobacterium chitinilyticum]RWX57691.1 MerR family transcriptional regulator [Photobacterium chitinilyticum]
MNMREFSERTKLSSHTLRYYEKIGLLNNVQRNSSGHRVFTTKELDWVNFIIRLKETAMPLDTILHYSNLRALGESTITARKTLLEEHRHKLQSQIENQLQHLNALETKIDFYKAIEVS